MLQVLQNGLQSTKNSITDNAMLERNADEQFLVSFEEVFNATEIEENTEKSDVSMAMTDEKNDVNEFSDVMQVKEVEENNDLETVQDVVIINENDNSEKKLKSTDMNTNIKTVDKSEKTFDKVQLLALLSEKQQEKKSNTQLEINLERLPKDFSMKVKGLISKKSNGKNNIEDISREVGALLLSHFQMKGNKSDKKVTSETFVKNVSSVAIKDGKLILKGSEELKQLKIVGKSEKRNNENQLSIGLKELLFSGKEQFAKTETSDSKSDKKIEALTVNNEKGKKSRFEKTSSATEKERTKSSSSIQTKDVLEMKNEIKENFSMPINNKQTSTEEIAKSFQEQKPALYEQITKQTKVLLTGDKVSFSTFIRPEEIGRVDFKFVSKDGKVNGKIILQNQEAADLFRSSVEDLRAVFQRANVELDKLEIQIAGRQNFEMGNFDFSGHSNNTGDRNAQSQEKTAAVGLHQAVKAFDEGAVAMEKNIYSGNGIHLVI